jgi:anti-sigma regulatory factor (Ser/Thr protein kinase)
MTGTFQKAVRKGESELIALLTEVEGFMMRHQAAPRAVSRVLIIFEEMILNLVKHATGSVTQDVELRLDVTEERILIHIADDGAAFDPRSAPEVDRTRPLEERPTGGMGLQIVRSLASEVHYERLDGRNHLRLVVANA